MQLALWDDSDAADRSGLRALPTLKGREGPGERSTGCAPVGGSSAALQGGGAAAHPLLPLDPLEAQAERYVQQAHAEATRRAYQTDWEAFEHWCQHRGVQALPASPDTLALYLTHLANLGRKTSTIRRARVAIGLAHGHAGLERPDRHARIRALERGIGRIHGTKEEGATPLLAEDVTRLAAVLRKSIRDQRDRALILLGFAGAFRAGELVGLNVEDLRFNAQGLDVFLARSKEDQLGKGTTVRIPRGEVDNTCPVKAVSHWVSCVGRPNGPLFRDVRGPNVEHARLHPRAVTRAVQRACTRVGLQGEYSAHSLRSGLATSAWAAGTPEKAILEHGRWKHRGSLDRYIRTERLSMRPNPATGLL